MELAWHLWGTCRLQQVTCLSSHDSKTVYNTCQFQDSAKMMAYIPDRAD